MVFKCGQIKLICFRYTSINFVYHVWMRKQRKEIYSENEHMFSVAFF